MCVADSLHGTGETRKLNALETLPRKKSDEKYYFL